MGMAAILFNGAEPFILSTESPMWNPVTIVKAVSEKKIKDLTILYMYIAQGQGQITPNILIVAKQF